MILEFILGILAVVMLFASVITGIVVYHHNNVNYVPLNNKLNNLSYSRR